MYTPSEPGGLGHSRSWFSYEELIKATNGFSTQNLLGEGGFGCVYKGCLPDGRDIAVKQLKIGGGQGDTALKTTKDYLSMTMSLTIPFIFIYMVKLYLSDKRLFQFILIDFDCIN